MCNVTKDYRIASAHCKSCFLAQHLKACSYCEFYKTLQNEFAGYMRQMKRKLKMNTMKVYERKDYVYNL